MEQLNQKIKNSLERIYPDQLDKNDTFGKEALALHLQRYQFAAEHLLAGCIADAACGAGYGSHLLATACGDAVQKIIAIDIDDSVISYARQRYAHPAVQYRQGDLLRFEFDHPVHTIVSLETIEHLPDPGRFVYQMSGQLVKGGRFIASAPVTPSVDANPHHLHDFTERSFRKLFTDAGLKEVSALLQVQQYNPWRVTNNSEGRRQDVRKGLLGYYLKNPASFWRRLRSIGIDGFKNKYLVVAFEKRTA